MNGVFEFQTLHITTFKNCFPNNEKSGQEGGMNVCNENCKEPEKHTVFIKKLQGKLCLI